MSNIARIICMLVMALAFANGAPQALAPALAQEKTRSAVDIQPMIDQARDSGVSVIVISPQVDDNPQQSAEPDMQEIALKMRAEFIRIFSKASGLPDAIVAMLSERSPDGTFNWLWIAIATALGGIVLGHLPALAVQSWTRNTFQSTFSEDVVTRSEKITYLMFRAFMITTNLAIMVVVAVLVAVVLDSGHPPSRGTIGTIIGAYAAYRFFRHVIFFNIIVPDAPTHRLINLNDEDADMMQRDWRFIAMLVIIICAFFVWLAVLGLSGDPLKLLVICSLAVCAVLISGLFYKHRAQSRAILLGPGDPTNKPWWRRVIASQLHLIMSLYLVIALLVSTWRIVLDLPSALAVIGAPVVALFGGIAIFGLLVIIIDRFYGARRRRFDEKVEIAREQQRRQAKKDEAARSASLATRSEDEDEEIIINQMMTAKALDQMPVFKPILKDLLEDAAAILVAIAGLGWVLAAWDVNIGERGNPVTGFLDTLFILFGSWFAYRVVVAYTNHQLEEEGELLTPEAGAPGEEMTGHGASRLATLLPLVRNVLVVLIVTLSGMIVLSNMGVDIAPLFAGAGVIGLAVGFGAQTMIRDIFSGGFFLFDDAFRKGEYIELGEIRGTVEKISLRSFQLRHHNGPLHTVPFGEITQLTNYSRDWVMMKLPLRVTYETDIERVRKLVKKLGQSLLEHPEVGSLFLQPLKSQGVYKMEDSAMIIRVKFMTKPGDQFVTRKVVYAAIRELFEREGIRFANKEVTVRIERETELRLTKEEEQAVSAAARRVTDDEIAEQAPQKADDGP